MHGVPLGRKQQILLNIAISLALFAAIFWLVGFDKILAVLLTAQPGFLAAALVTYFIVTVVMSYRIKVVLASMGERLGLAQIAPSNLAGMLASDFTPARVGYFLAAFSLSSRHRIKLEKTFIAIFGPQLFDFLIKAFSAAILTALIVQKTGTNDVLLNVVVIGAALAAIFSAALVVFYPPLLARLAFLARFQSLSRVFGFVRRMHEHSDRIFAVKWRVVAITSVTWFLKGVEWLLISRALGIVITGDTAYDLGFMMVLQGAITIIQFIPSPTIAGAGASEAAFAAVLLAFGVPFESSVTFGFLTRAVMVAVDAFSLPLILDYLRRHSLESVLERLLGSGTEGGTGSV